MFCFRADGRQGCLPLQSFMTDYNFKPKTSAQEFGWHWRNLPHFDGPQQTQFVTFRLFDSLPAHLLDAWRVEAESDAAFRKRVERFLDSASGSCWLREQKVAEIVRNALKFHEGSKYELFSWVIMPNHCHVLLRPFKDEHVPQIMHSLKSFTASKANAFLGRKGTFWQAESFDRYIRTPRHFLSVVRYIENNPVKARLCSRPEDWEFSSAFDRARAR